MTVTKKIPVRRFVPDPNTAFKVAHKQVRYMLPKGTIRCRGGNPILDLLQTECAVCGFISPSVRNKMYEAHIILAKQESWHRARITALPMINGTATATWFSLISEYAAQKIRLLQQMMDDIPIDAPSYEVVVIPMALEYIVRSQMQYYKTMHSQERLACATQGISEHHCLDCSRSDSYFHLDAGVGFYDHALGHNVHYLDLYPSLQGKHYVPGVEKMAKN